MNTICLNLTIHAALELIRNTTISPDVRDEIQHAIAHAFSKENAKHPTKYLNMTLKTVNPTRKIRCIAAVRKHLGWDLKESKEFVETVLGRALNDGIYAGGTPASLTGLTEDVKDLVAELKQNGCEVVVDTWGCESNFD